MAEYEVDRYTIEPVEGMAGPDDYALPIDHEGRGQVLHPKIPIDSAARAHDVPPTVVLDEWFDGRRRLVR